VSGWPRPATIDAAVRECYAAHTILTNLGYEPDDIYVGIVPVLNAAPSPATCAIVKLVRHDGEAFVYTVRDLAGDEIPEFKRKWLAFVADKPTMQRAELDAILHGSTVWARKTELLWTLAAKGFPIEPGKVTN